MRIPNSASLHLALGAQGAHARLSSSHASVSRHHHILLAGRLARHLLSGEDEEETGHNAHGDDDDEASEYQRKLVTKSSPICASDKGAVRNLNFTASAMTWSRPVILSQSMARSA